jgi:hypothetical protein
MCRKSDVCLCGVHTVFELVWCMCVRQSVPSFGALHLVVGMNFSVPETTDIWSADKTALVPFITELTVRYTTRVRALTETQVCVRERDFCANLSVALPHWQGLSGWTDWGVQMSLRFSVEKCNSHASFAGVVAGCQPDSKGERSHVREPRSTRPLKFHCGAG